MLNIDFQVAQIDNQNDGMLPSHCYSILTIHFLQARGVLPILHDLLGIKVDNAPTFSSMSNFSGEVPAFVLV